MKACLQSREKTEHYIFDETKSVKSYLKILTSHSHIGLIMNFIDLYCKKIIFLMKNFAKIIRKYVFKVHICCGMSPPVGDICAILIVEEKTESRLHPGDVVSQ